MASKNLLQIRMETAKKILTNLHELAVKPDLSEVERDALIQRFEFSFELFGNAPKNTFMWKKGLMRRLLKRSSAAVGNWGCWMRGRPRKPCRWQMTGI